MSPPDASGSKNGTGGNEPINASHSQPLGERQGERNSSQSFSNSPQSFNASMGFFHDGASFGSESMSGGGRRRRRAQYVNPQTNGEAYDPKAPYYLMDINKCFVQTGSPDVEVTKSSGLNNRFIEKHREELGGNLIPVSGGPSWFKLLAKQFLNVITVILGIVVVISGIFEDWAEFGVVLFVIIFNGLLGFVQEWGAEKSLQSLQNMTKGSATVMRSEQIQMVLIDDVVVGDVVILEQGFSVPADIRLFEATNLEIDESLLTGETMPVAKFIDNIEASQDGLEVPLGDRKNMGFRNTLVTQGRGKGVVVSAGTYTEMGKLAKQLTQSDGKSSKTALMKKLELMMLILFGCCIILGVVVFASDKFIWNPSTLLYSCAVAIAIIPECLNLVITVAMAISVRRMAAQKCIVRKLPVLEVLSGVTDICSDKTGTLTENKMVVKTASFGITNNYNLVGAPYSSKGFFFDDSVDLDDLHVSFSQSAFRNKREKMENKGPLYDAFFRAAALCSSTYLYEDGETQTMKGSGNPTEIAIQVMTWKAELNREHWETEEGWELFGEYAFDSEVKRMSAVYRKKEKFCSNIEERNKNLYSATKGAPERILELCRWYISDDGKINDLTEQHKEEINETIHQFARRGLRTICFSQRNTEVSPIEYKGPANERLDKEVKRDEIEKDLIYIGIVGIFDPPRPSSGPSVLTCQKAGVVVRMLTGDHADTAASIAESLAIIDSVEDDSAKIITGPNLDATDNKELDDLIDLPRVVGRCSPQSKVKMIESLHRRKRIVAMTGDGFNDSPSIKTADVGFAMGSGTDVTKGVADIIITDDNFATIVVAVKEGRRIQAAIKKFVVHLLSGNVAEVIALILGLPIKANGHPLFILSPLEILWLNMFTGSPPATGLCMDEASPEIMFLPPSTVIFNKELILDIVVYGVILGCCSLASFIVVAFWFHEGFPDNGVDCNKPSGGPDDCSVAWTARTTAFVVLYMGLLIHAYNVRNTRKSIFLIKWLDNAWLWGSVAFSAVTLMGIIYIPAVAQNVFIHKKITWEWAVIGIMLGCFVGGCEIWKLFKNKFMPLPLIHVEHKHRGLEMDNNGRPNYANRSIAEYEAEEADSERDEEAARLESLSRSMSGAGLATSFGMGSASVEEIARANLNASYAADVTHKGQNLK